MRKSVTIKVTLPKGLGCPDLKNNQKKCLFMVVCPTHSIKINAKDGLHVISSRPLQDCGNYIFECPEGCKVCPAHGIIEKKLKKK